MNLQTTTINPGSSTNTAQAHSITHQYVGTKILHPKNPDQHRTRHHTKKKKKKKKSNESERKDALILDAQSHREVGRAPEEPREAARLLALGLLRARAVVHRLPAAHVRERARVVELERLRRRLVPPDPVQLVPEVLCLLVRHCHESVLACGEEGEGRGRTLCGGGERVPPDHRVVAESPHVRVGLPRIPHDHIQVLVRDQASPPPPISARPSDEIRRDRTSSSSGPSPPPRCSR